MRCLLLQTVLAKQAPRAEMLPLPLLLPQRLWPAKAADAQLGCALKVMLTVPKSWVRLMHNSLCLPISISVPFFLSVDIDRCTDAGSIKNGQRLLLRRGTATGATPLAVDTGLLLLSQLGTVMLEYGLIFAGQLLV